MHHHLFAFAKLRRRKFFGTSLRNLFNTLKVLNDLDFPSIFEISKRKKRAKSHGVYYEKHFGASKFTLAFLLITPFSHFLRDFALFT